LIEQHADLKRVFQLLIGVKGIAQTSAIALMGELLLLRMERPLRLEFSGALYHVTSRGDRREDVFLSDEDRNQIRHPNRDHAIAQAYLSGAYTMAEIGRHFGIH
jgi:hypothetical protein